MNYFRQVDTIFDLLAGLGGFFNALSLICFCFVSVFQFHGSYQLVMHDLFTEVKSSGLPDQNPNQSRTRKLKA